MVTAVKAVTSADVFSGMVHAVQQVIHDADVNAIMVGTTHFINALLQRRGLARVCIIRICGPATHAIPPMSNWPKDLKETVCEETNRPSLTVEFALMIDLDRWSDCACLWWLFFRWIRNQSIE